MKEKYKLICLSPGGDHVIEGYFKTVDEAEKRSCDMGSRWYFYPYHCVVTGKSNKIVSVGFDDGDGFVGRKLHSLKYALATDLVLEGNF